jgi:uncharacterized protein (TIGR03435 family)
MVTRLQIRLAALVPVVLPAILAAQQSADAKFDVVSIRVVPPNTPPTLREFGFTPILPGGQFVDSRIGLHSMIAFAYNVQNSRQLTGLPKWAQEESYSVAAKPAEGFPVLTPAQNREQVRLMMRTMLADRFHLRVHTETREETVFYLEVAKGGIRIKEVEAPLPPVKELPVQLVLGDNGGRMIGEKSTIESIARAIALWLKRPVTDRTGLKGYYDFDVRWNAQGQSASDELGPAGLGLLIAMLPDQLGLRLAKAIGPVEYWVVDHVEPPTGN